MHNGVLSEADVAILASDRQFLPAVLQARFPGRLLQGSALDLPLMQQVLEGGPYTPDAISELIALGTALGDVLASSLGMTWVRHVCDDGEELALRYRDTDVVVYARTLLLDRLERNEAINLELIHDEVCRDVRRTLSDGGETPLM